MLNQNQKMKSTPYRQNLNSSHDAQAAAAAAAVALQESSPRDDALTPPTQRIILDQLLDSPAKAVNNVACGLYNVWNANPVPTRAPPIWKYTTTNLITFRKNKQAEEPPRGRRE